MGLDCPFVQLDQPPHESQADPQPALGPIERTICLGEKFEYPSQQIGCNANAIIANTNDGLFAGLTTTSEIDPPGSVYFAALFKRLVQPASAAPYRRGA